MKTKKLPSEIKLCLFDIISTDLNDRIFEAINEHLIKTYGATPSCFGFDEEMALVSVEWNED